MSESKSPRKILHIVSASRSGSTILDRTLGHHRRAFSIGEILNLQEDYRRNSLCGCGAFIRDCPFWTPVIQELGAGTGQDPAAFVEQFALKYPKPTGLAHRSHQLRHALGLGLGLPPRAFADTTVYRRTGRLYDQVFRATGADLIVDSSKSMVRALMLSRVLPRYEHHFVHLIRDGRGVLHSNLKKTYRVKLKNAEGELITREIENHTDRSPRAVVKDWVKVNRKIERFTALFGTRQRTVRVHLETFLADPPAELGRILAGVGLAFEPEMLTFTYGDNHMVCGNSSRLNAMTLRRDDRDWNQLLTPDLLEVFASAGGQSLNDKYNYS